MLQAQHHAGISETTKKKKENKIIVIKDSIIDLAKRRQEQWLERKKTRKDVQFSSVWKKENRSIYKENKNKNKKEATKKKKKV